MIRQIGSVSILHNENDGMRGWEARKKIDAKSGPSSDRSLIGSFIFAGVAASLAIKEAVGAEAHIHHGLAKAAELFAFAGGF
jgi:hypothetical protein